MRHRATEQANLAGLFHHLVALDDFAHGADVLVSVPVGHASEVGHAQVADHVVDVGDWVEHSLALFPHGQRLAVDLKQLVVHGAVVRRQVVQDLLRNPHSRQLAVSLGASVLDVGARHLHVAFLLVAAGHGVGKVLVQATQCDVLLALHVTHDEAEHGVTDLAHLLALFAGEVAPDRDLGIDRRIEVGVTLFPSLGKPRLQLIHGHGLEDAATLEARAADTLHGLLAAKQCLGCLGPLACLALERLLVEAWQVLAIPAVGSLLAQHAEADQLIGLLAHDRLHRCSDLQDALGWLDASLQLTLDHVADHLALVFTQLAQLRGHACGFLAGLLDLGLHAAHADREVVADWLE